MTGTPMPSNEYLTFLSGTRAGPMPGAQWRVVAIHHHMTADWPMIIFLHYWGTGPAAKLAAAFKAAVNELGKHGGTASR